MDDSRKGDELFSFLKQCELFSSLPDRVLARILEKCTFETYGPGSVIFRVGDPADKVYVIRSGVVEICREDRDRAKPEIVAYLGEREILGEMSILTGSPRGSLARVPERAVLLTLTRDAFVGLLETVPLLAIRLATLLAERLEAWIRKERLHIKGQELSGSLEYFDSSTLIQTLADSDRTGLLTIMDGQKETVAEIYIEGGEVCSARMGHLAGTEAFYQLFQSEEGKSFTFKVGAIKEVSPIARIPHRTIAVLLEANRLQDELNRLKQRIPDAERIFLPKVRELSWKDEGTFPLAKEIWALICQGKPLSHILQKVPVSHYSIYRIVAEMLDQGQIAL
ncbi:MAG: cyclic nucleotide-binding domain-containing protein [Deltaproteobacteria bacterium]|nr:cyclic nucleotide-binding domain-containing protein [Deltaproteobacteria bacterium]MBW2123415.1 cyclic nucleotide-binding domain-containing protein [Deltaproteobacteria bacterium]